MYPSEDLGVIGSLLIGWEVARTGRRIQGNARGDRSRDGQLLLYCGSRWKAKESIETA
jgi:hypothetical protein